MPQIFSSTREASTSADILAKRRGRLRKVPLTYCRGTALNSLSRTSTNTSRIVIHGGKQQYDYDEPVSRTVFLQYQ